MTPKPNGEAQQDHPGKDAGAGRRKGLFLVITGDGKGKTTAALGLALRAAGHGFKVRIIQFIKRGREDGEYRALKGLKGIEIEALGLGLPSLSKIPYEEHARAAADAWKRARQVMAEGDYDLLILDEATHVLNRELVGIEEFLQACRSRPAGKHLAVTGREAPPELVQAADTVTEMLNIKHHYQEGIPAVRGIEY